MLIPKEVEENNDKESFKIIQNNLYNNQQSLINMYDLHDTLIQFSFGEFDNNNETLSKYGESIFSKINNKQNTVKVFQNKNCIKIIQQLDAIALNKFLFI